MRGRLKPLGFLHQRVLDVLTQAADEGRRSPSNSELTDALDLGAGRASAMVSELERRGLIRVNRSSSSRVVTIVATGKSTADDTRRGSRELRSVADSFRGEPPEHLRVDRDPCPRCGVRRDIGCAHGGRRVVAGVLGVAG